MVTFGTILNLVLRLAREQISAVTKSTTGGTVTRAQAVRGITLSNIGATGTITFALPPATPGLKVSAIVEAAQQLRLDPSGTETIALPSTGVQSAAGAYIVADALAETVDLVCITKGTWSVQNFQGTWTAV